LPKVGPDEEGVGSDDAAEALRYPIAVKANRAERYAASKDGNGI